MSETKIIPEKLWIKIRFNQYNSGGFALGNTYEVYDEKPTIYNDDTIENEFYIYEKQTKKD